MTIKHEKGVMSNHGDIFYYSAHWSSWSRLLLRYGREQGFHKEIAIGLTAVHQSRRNRDLHLVRAEGIRLYHNISKHVDDIYTHVLPYPIYEQMVGVLGIPATKKLIDFDYLSSLDIDKLIYLRGLAPFSEVKLPEPFVGSLTERLKHYPEIYRKPRRK